MSPRFDFSKSPPRRSRATARRTLQLRSVTPILGGGVRLRDVDLAEPVRAASVRGILRFWWRATLRDLPSDPADLAARERELWGGVDGEEPIRSAVVIRVRDVAGAVADRSDVGFGDQGAYALWPARGTRQGAPPAPRWQPGLVFTLEVDCPSEFAGELERALSAWVCFGGYGARTRRGVGALAPASDEVPDWLVPRTESRDDLDRFFAGWGFGAFQAGATDLPRFRNSSLAVGSGCAKAGDAWARALDWLNAFRQGAPAHGPLGTYDPQHARVRGMGHRPSISNWPEADKRRHLQRGNWSHPPRHGADPAWPRAGFGLPIQVQFQRKARDGGRHYEPDNFELRWSRDRQSFDRLASPLFVGCMPLGTGRFAPFALWLWRAFPREGLVGLKGSGGDVELSGRAPFDKLVGNGDPPLFTPLARGQEAEQGNRLRTAFFSWLQEQKTQEVKWSIG